MVQQEVGGEAGCCGSSRGLLFHTMFYLCARTWIALRGPGGGYYVFKTRGSRAREFPLSKEMTSFPRKVRGLHELRGFCLKQALYHYLR